MDSQKLDSHQNDFIFRRIAHTNKPVEEPSILIMPETGNSKIMEEHGRVIPVSAFPTDRAKLGKFEGQLHHDTQTMMSAIRDQKLSAGICTVLLFPDGTNVPGGYLGLNDLALTNSSVGNEAAKFAKSTIVRAQSIPPDCPSAQAYWDHCKKGPEAKATL